MSEAELEARGYLLPGRTVEIYLAGEGVDGRPVNVTFNVTRSRVPPVLNMDDDAETKNATRQLEKETEVAAIREEERQQREQVEIAQSEQKPADGGRRLLSVEEEGDGGTDRQEDDSASSLWPTVRRLLSIDTLTRPISKIASLFSTPVEQLQRRHVNHPRLLRFHALLYHLILRRRGLLTRRLHPPLVRLQRGGSRRHPTLVLAPHRHQTPSQAPLLPQLRLALPLAGLPPTTAASRCCPTTRLAGRGWAT